VQARHCSQWCSQTGLSACSAMFPEGQILSQIPQKLHFSSTQKLLSIAGTWEKESRLSQVKRRFCHRGPLSTGLSSLWATEAAITFPGTPQIWTGKMFPSASARLSTASPETAEIGMISASPNSLARVLAAQSEFPVPV